MKKIIIIAFLAISGVTFAQNKNCNCRTPQGNYSLTVDGKATYKGTNTTSKHQYDLNLSFKNESNCDIKVVSVKIGEEAIDPSLILTTDTKGRKKYYRKSIQLNTKLDPSIGLDDALFADLMVSYSLNGKPCSHEVTVGYGVVKRK